MVVLLLVVVAGIQVLVLLLKLPRCSCVCSGGVPLVAPLLAPLPPFPTSPAEHGLHARLLVLCVVVVVVWWWAWCGAVCALCGGEEGSGLEVGT
jgi:hypothetical protein